MKNKLLSTKIKLEVCTYKKYINIEADTILW